MSNSNSNNTDSSNRRLTSWSSQPVDSYEYRRQLAQKESVGAGLFYSAAAGVAGSALVARTRSLPVKVLTPVAFAALTANYFLPAHSDYYFNNMGRPFRFGRTANVDPRQTDKVMDLKENAQAAVGQASRDVSAAWDDVKSKAEGVADTYRTVGKEGLSKLANTTQEAKYWLDQQKAEVDSMLGKEDTRAASDSQGGLLGRKLASDATSETMRRRADDLRDNTPLKREERWWNQKRAAESNATAPSSSTKMDDATPASAGSYNFFGWWKSDDGSGDKPELQVKMASQSPDDEHRTYVEHKLHETNAKPARKRRASNADLHVAKEAIRGHDAAVTRGAMLGKADAEATGRKVHDNVIDAAVPRHRQTPYEPHEVEETRSVYERKRLNKLKSDVSHGLENLDRRAHMMLNGVEHIEHSINKKMEKILQDEADFWHEQALKDEARARNMEAQANQANARGERAF